MMADKVRVNGNVVSWGSIKVKIGGEVFHGFTSIAFADSRERAFVYGMGKHHGPRGRTRGKYATEATKLAGPRSTVQALCDKLQALASDQTSYGDVEFPIVVQYVEADETPMTVELEQNVITKRSSSEDEGTEFLKEEIEISTMRIRRNGGTLWDNSEGSP
jgi:hypothetical protein